MKKSSGGFVLIEAVVSMMIFALGFLGVAKMQVAVVEASAEAKARAEAMTFAQGRMDELRLVARYAEHTAAGCTAGSVVADQVTGPIAGVNASYTMTTAVTRSCNPDRHRVIVTVAWTDARAQNRNVVLNGVIAWQDPARNLARSVDGGAGGGSVGTPSNVRLGDNVKDYDGLPSGSKPNGKDGSSIFYNSTTGEYELLVKTTGGYRVALYSNVPIVRVSGLVALDTKSDSEVDDALKLSTLAVYRTDITFCLYPLTFADANNPNTYGQSGDSIGVASATNDKAGAYVCYVPEGWAGNVGILNYGSHHVCPEDAIDPKKVVFVGTRTHRVLIKSGSSIVGQSGVLLGHQNMVMTNYPDLGRLDRLDFFVSDISAGGCKARFYNSKTNTFFTEAGTIFNNGTSISYQIFLRNGAPDSRDDGTFDIGVPSVTFSPYAVDSYTASVDGGFLKVNGAVNGTCTNIRATNGTKNFICTVDAGNYSCSVSYGWSGNVGYWTGTVVSGGGAVGPVLINTNGPAVTCP